MTINSYKLLKQKEIIQILDGDATFGELPYKDTSINDIFDLPPYVTISMPSLTANEICDISTRFGFPMKIIGNKSRRQYFEDMLDNLIQSGRCSELLAFLFDKSQFARKLSCLSTEIIDEHYNKIINIVLEKINQILYCSGNELKIIDKKFIIRPTDTRIEIYAPSIEKIIDRNYIAKLSKRALQDVEAGHFDSALTKSRTLLEETFLHVIEKKQKIPKNKGDIGELYKCVRNLYNMNIDKENDKRIKELLSGLAKIVSAIAEMRNANSDAHGLGTKRKFNIKDYHARLLVNSAMTLSDFILSVSENNLSPK